MGNSLDVSQLSTCCGKPLEWERQHADWWDGTCPECGCVNADAQKTAQRSPTPTESLLLARIAELEAANAELLATLANERGEGEPPCEGWEWEPLESGWAIWNDGGGFYVTRTPDGWTWDADRIRSGTPHFDTARDAIRAASGVS